MSAGYFRRWNGNFNTVGTPEPRGDEHGLQSVLHHGTRESAAARRWRKAAVRVLRREPGEVRQVDNLIPAPSNFGRQEDVFDGFDFTVNARLPRRAFLRGGLGLGRQRTNNCYTLEDRSLCSPGDGTPHDAVL